MYSPQSPIDDKLGGIKNTGIQNINKNAKFHDQYDSIFFIKNKN